jgi:hypothetical protein
MSVNLSHAGAENEYAGLRMNMQGLALTKQKAKRFRMNTQGLALTKQNAKLTVRARRTGRYEWVGDSDPCALAFFEACRAKEALKRAEAKCRAEEAGLKKR